MNTSPLEGIRHIHICTISPIEVMDDFASNRNTITMLVVIDLYTTSLESNHYCRELNQLKSWYACNAETKSNVLTL